jgi:hypothetical protein
MELENALLLLVHWSCRPVCAAFETECVCYLHVLQVCQRESHCFEPFMDLMLPIPEVATKRQVCCQCLHNSSAESI